MKYYDEIHVGSFEGHTHVTKLKKPKNGKKKISKRERLIKNKIQLLKDELKSDLSADKRINTVSELEFLKKQLYSIRH